MTILKTIKNIFFKKVGETWPIYENAWLNTFPQQATIEDIYFCFRLILGRNPNKEEWPGHSGRAGENLTDIVQTYIQSQEFANRNLLQRATPENIKIAKYDNFQIYAAEDDIAVGKNVLAGHYEIDVTHVFNNLVKSDMGVLDIGANIGYYSMLSSALVGSDGWIMAVEPNAENVKMIEASRRLNNFGQLKVIQAAASKDNGIMVFKNEYSNGTCSFLPNEEGELFASDTVACINLDMIVDKKVDIIKVDVEGAELLALQGCINIINKDKPTVFFEFSPNRIINEHGNIAWQELLAIFFELGYNLSVIQSQGQLSACKDAQEVYQAFEESGVDHIDLIAINNDGL